MSLASLCAPSAAPSASIQRVAVTQGAAGGQQRTYTKAARGSLPTTSQGRLNLLSGDRRNAYAMHDQSIIARWYTTTNPQCGVQDQLVIGTETYFVHAQRNPDNVSRYFILDLANFSRELQ